MKSGLFHGRPDEHAAHRVMIWIGVPAAPPNANVFTFF
jgi:hypothetical protein